jgi:hypothetical protein
VVRGVHLARLKVADADVTEPVPAGARGVTFRVKLKAGPTRLQGWFLNNDSLAGATFGPYYVGVSRVPAAR